MVVSQQAAETLPAMDVPGILADFVPGLDDPVPQTRVPSSNAARRVQL